VKCPSCGRSAWMTPWNHMSGDGFSECQYCGRIVETVVPATRDWPAVLLIVVVWAVFVLCSRSF
jgi:uncharacterized protein (DUF983 family)